MRKERLVGFEETPPFMLKAYSVRSTNYIVNAVLALSHEPIDPLP